MLWSMRSIPRLQHVVEIQNRHVNGGPNVPMYIWTYVYVCNVPMYTPMYLECV